MPTAVPTHVTPKPHRWSGWPGAWCLDCGLEDQDELDLAYEGEPLDPSAYIPHRYSATHHVIGGPCSGCDRTAGPCAEPGSGRNDPYRQ